MITWEPFACSGTYSDVETRAAGGEYDAYLNTWTDRLKLVLSGTDGIYGTADDRRVFLRLAHEMNGDWYPWSAAMGGISPADYIAMWQRVWGIFANKSLGPTHVQWVWAVNHDDVGGFAAEQ